MKKEHCVKLIKQIEESNLIFESVNFPHKKHLKTDINTPIFSWFNDMIKKDYSIDTAACGKHLIY